MGKIYFKEEQRFTQVWIWMLLIALSGLWIWEFIQQIIMGIPFGDKPAPDIVVILTGIFPLLAIILFRSLILETSIDEEGVAYRFRPFQRKFKVIKATDIARYEVKKYSPLKDYGGWGIRYGSSKNGKAYNVKGNQGVLFEFKSGKRFMLGTQKPSEIRSALDKLMKSS
jgi:hypothetical protein